MNLPRRPRAFAYRMFYGLPGYARRRLVRLVAPKFVVGAVAIVRDSDSDADSDGGAAGPLLLLRQPSNRAWSLPAGLLKRGEQPSVAAARELFEETGVRIDPADLVPGVPNAIVHAVGVVDTVWFGSVAASTTELRVDGGEVLEAGWFPADDLPELTVNTANLLGRYGIGPRAAHRQR